MTSPKSLILPPWKVRAILDDKASQLRVVVKPQPEAWRGEGGWMYKKIINRELRVVENLKTGKTTSEGRLVPLHEFLLKHGPYRVGDIIAVKEEWHDDFEHNRVFYRADEGEDGLIPYMIPGEGFGGGVGGARITAWRPARTMPPEAVRLHLRITEIRVHRVQEISEGDASKEGVERLVLKENTIPGVEPPFNRLHPLTSSYIDAYRSAFDADHGAGSWGANPFVWAVSFEKARQE